MPEETNPQRGGRTILITVRFATDGIADEPGHIIPGFCYDSGFVNIPKEGNEEHNLRTLEAPVVFETLEELPWAVGEALRLADACVLRSRSPKK